MATISAKAKHLTQKALAIWKFCASDLDSLRKHDGIYGSATRLILDMWLLLGFTGGLIKMNTARSAEMATSTWKIDPVHAITRFSIGQMMISNGWREFGAISGTFEAGGILLGDQVYIRPDGEFAQ
jgi:hypothetical protein